LVTGCTGSPTQADGTVSVTNTTTTTTTTTIPDLTPASVSASPSGRGLASATLFMFAVSSPPSGGVPPYSFAWNLGDGAAAIGASVSHVYAGPGSFTATLTTTDSRGISVSSSSSAVVTDTVTGRWVASLDRGGTSLVTRSQNLDLIQNMTAVTVTITDTANQFGLATGTGNVANPRNLSVSAIFTNSKFIGADPINPWPATFAVNYVGDLDATFVWRGVVTGLPDCPCPFTARR